MRQSYSEMTLRTVLRAGMACLLAGVPMAFAADVPSGNAAVTGAASDAASSATSDAARAEQSSDTADSTLSATEDIPTVTVVGSAIRNDDAADPDTTAPFVTVLTEKDFPADATSASDIVERASGLYVRNTGGVGSSSTVSIRGSTAQQVAICLDGVMLNSAMGGGVDLSGIPANQIEAIEIYRGAAPASFGDSGLGGLINIRTKRALASRTTVSGDVGSFGLERTSVAHFQNSPRTEVTASAEYLQSDGDFPFTNSNGTPANPDDDREDTRQNNDVEQHDALVRMRHHLTDTVTLTVRDTLLDKENGLAGREYRQAEKTRLDSFTNNLYAGAEWLPYQLPGARVEASGYHHYDSTDYHDPLGEVGLGEQENEYVSRQYGGVLDTTLPLGQRHLLQTRGEIREESFVSDEKLSVRGDPPGTSRESFFVTTEDRIELVPDRLTLIPGIRYQRHESEREDAEYVGFHTTPIPEGSTYDATDPQCGLIFNMTPDWLWKANIGSATRAPSLFELYGDRGTYQGNPQLVPEESVNMDLGLRYSVKDPSDWCGLFTAEWTVFHRDAENLIRTVYNSAGVGHSENLSSATITGMELAVSTEWRQHFRMHHSLTFQETETGSDYAYESSAEVPGLPACVWNSRFEVFGQLWNEAYEGSVWLEYTGDTGGYYDAANLLPREEDRCVNLGVEVRHGDLRCTAVCTNVADRERMDVPYYPLPGRAFVFSVQYSF